MAYLVINTHTITPAILSNIGSQIQNGLSSGKTPEKWEVFDTDPPLDFDKSSLESLSESIASNRDTLSAMDDYIRMIRDQLDRDESTLENIREELEIAD